VKRQQKGFGLLELLVVIAVIGVIASLSIAAYQQYIIRAQVTEGIVLSNGVRQVIIDEYLETGDWPNNNNLAGLVNLNLINGDYTKSIKVQRNKITVMFGNNSHQNIFHQKVTIEIVENDGRFSWTCEGHAKFPDRYLPRACRA
jgi:type IV pilus assembly protein PilA